MYIGKYLNKFAAKCYSSGDEMKGNECKQGRYGSVRFVDQTEIVEFCGKPRN